jgi:hypothetical protein
MKQQFKLEIKTPCREKWDGFKKLDAVTGHCGSCSRNVVDFTGFSDRQIREYFKNAPLNVCGRLRADQMKVYTEKKPAASRFAAFLALGALLSPIAGYSSGKTLPETEQVSYLELQKQAVKDSLRKPEKYTITGQILSAEDNMGIPGVSLAIANSSITTYTDAEGRFTLKIRKEDMTPASDTLQINISSVGFFQIRKIINLDKPEIKFTEKLETEVLGGIHYSRISPRWFWYRLKGLFGG